MPLKQDRRKYQSRRNCFFEEIYCSPVSVVDWGRLLPYNGDVALTATDLEKIFGTTATGPG